MHIRPTRPDEAPLLRTLRLRSLADAPYAFGPHGFDEESSLPDSYWQQLAAQVGGEDPVWHDRAVCYVAFDGDEPGGMATCFLCPQVPRRAYVTAAWVDSRHRRHGLGRQLIDEACTWAAARGADHVRLWVDETNPTAAEFYLAIGFVATGESQPVSEGSTERQTGYERPLP